VTVKASFAPASSNASLISIEFAGLNSSTPLDAVSTTVSSSLAVGVNKGHPVTCLQGSVACAPSPVKK